MLESCIFMYIHFTNIHIYIHCLIRVFFLFYSKRWIGKDWSVCYVYSYLCYTKWSPLWKVIGQTKFTHNIFWLNFFVWSYSLLSLVHENWLVCMWSYSLLSLVHEDWLVFVWSYSLLSLVYEDWLVFVCSYSLLSLVHVDWLVFVWSYSLLSLMHEDWLVFVWSYSLLSLIHVDWLVFM